MDTISTNLANTISTNVTSTVLPNSDDKKINYKIDSYILHMVLLLIMLLFIIAIVCYHYTKYRSKQEGIDALTIRKPRIMNLKKFLLKIVRVIISMT